MGYALALTYSGRYHEATDYLRVARNTFYEINLYLEARVANDEEQRLIFNEFLVAYNIADNPRSMMPRMIGPLIKWGKAILEDKLALSDENRGKITSIIERLSSIKAEKAGSVQETTRLEPNEEYMRYRDYCWKCNLFLSDLDALYPFTESYPELSKGTGIAKEDAVCCCLRRKRDNHMLYDIIQSYCHARYLFYQYQMVELPIYPKFGVIRDDRYGPRLEDQEILIDCYIRLYSTIEKVVRLIGFVFGIDEFRFNHKEFTELVKKVKSGEKTLDPNLDNVFQLLCEIRPSPLRNEKVSDGLIFYEMWPDMRWMDSIRNSIMHAGISIRTAEGKVMKPQNYLLELKEKDLDMQTQRLLFIVKNAILYTYDAILLDGKRVRRTAP